MNPRQVFPSRRDCANVVAVLLPQRLLYFYSALSRIFFFFVNNGVNFVIVDKCLKTLLPSLHFFWSLGSGVHSDVIEGKLDWSPPCYVLHNFLF